MPTFTVCHGAEDFFGTARPGLPHGRPATRAERLDPAPTDAVLMR